MIGLVILAKTPAESTVQVSNMETTGPATTAAPKSDDFDPNVTFEEIYLAYQKNQLSADDLYKGNRYKLTCIIYNVDDGGINGLLGDISVSAYTYCEGKQCVLWCAFDKKTQRDGLSKVTMGDTITFIGTCESWGNWYSCELQ